LQAMGLGGWIHACFEGPFLMGHPAFDRFTNGNRGLGFEYVIPDDSILLQHSPRRELLANPIGLPPHIRCFCPPYYSTMDDAVDAVLEIKFGKDGAYNNREMMAAIFKNDLGDKYLMEVPRYTDEVIQVC